MRGRNLSAVVLSAALAMATAMAGCGDDDPVTTGGGAQPDATTITAATPGATTTTAAGGAGATVSTASSSLGTILVDADGMTLYTWDRDTGPTSACTGNCAATWPPLVLPAGSTTPVAGTGVSGELTAVPRPDDATKMQVVRNGEPLYTYAADTAPGDTKGHGVAGTWHMAKPA